MKKLFSLFSMLVLLSSNALPTLTYANTESEELAKEILIEELDNVFDSWDLLQWSVITTSWELGEEDSQETVITTAELMTWSDFNFKIKKLANSAITNNTTDTLIRTFTRSKILIDWLWENNLISSNNSENPIYAWFDNWTIYYYSVAKIIYFPEDASSMFSNLKNFEEINMKEFDTSRIKRMYRTFADTNIESIDFSKMNFENVEYAEWVFQSCSNLKYANFSESIFSWLVNSSQWFFRDRWSLISVNLSGADFRNLKSMSYMFWYNYELVDVDFTNANFWSATTTYCMFVGNNKLTNVKFKWTNLQSLTNIQWMFMEGAKNVDFSFADMSSLSEASRSDSFIPSNIVDLNFEWTNLWSLSSMKYWFQSKNNLKRINFSWTILTSLTDMSYMFQSNESLTWIDFSNTDLSSVTKMEYMFSSAYWIKYVNFSWSNLQNLTSTKEMFNAAKNLTWVSFHWAILTGLINVEEMFKSSYDHEELFNVDLWETKLWTTLNSMFKYSRVNTISFSWADFTKVEDAWKLFYYIPTLLKINFTNIKWANNIANMESMFYQDSQLTWIDLSVFDLSKVKNMYWMFQNCYSLKNINFWNWKIKPEWSLYSMFENNYYLKKYRFIKFWYKWGNKHGIYVC